ncbi:hypothetical protein PACID_30390 [Acidipropionibacterium acidipropionici ATCC 4875]|uniref:Uncharacterized protein n=1 Tax=Acidipropionibacterium acidipropionici (strain ATCC 4875 / DSM 20272 / JCM 6432 / NBRC 12425 / NCIMB 8070 / 4) TaxID=1171373 RepID=K7S0G8_ACIA4|nr:hypothetical protein PACID_30390 [Acidipropionibacterium acidipropionici ATCC 4875]
MTAAGLRPPPHRICQYRCTTTGPESSKRAARYRVVPR